MAVSLHCLVKEKMFHCARFVVQLECHEWPAGTHLRLLSAVGFADIFAVNVALVVGQLQLCAVSFPLHPSADSKHGVAQDTSRVFQVLCKCLLGFELSLSVRLSLFHKPIDCLLEAYLHKWSLVSSSSEDFCSGKTNVLFQKRNTLYFVIQLWKRTHSSALIRWIIFCLAVSVCWFFKLFENGSASVRPFQKQFAEKWNFFPGFSIYGVYIVSWQKHWFSHLS